MLVIGAGVIGLTTAITLAEAGVPTTVWAADPIEATTSYAAGASWGVHLLPMTDPDARERVTGWSAVTLNVLRSLAQDPSTGVRVAAGVEACRKPTAAPAWGPLVGGLRECTPDELPPGYAVGWKHRLPIVDMPVYLDYLGRRLTAAGATIERRRIGSLDEAVAAARVVVNCAGVGARELTGDASLVPVRGQVVIVANPGLTDFFADGPDDSADLTYFFPHGDTVLLGGTANAGDWSRAPDPAVATSIIERCAAIDPRLGGARVLGHRVGLRPGRPEPRLEADAFGSVRVVHNYGHGGSGVTLAWGCAAEAAALATV